MNGLSYFSPQSRAPVATSTSSAEIERRLYPPGDPPRQDGADAQLSARFARVRGALEAKHRRAGHDPEGRQAGHLVDQALRDAVAQVVVVGLARSVLERQDGERVDRRGPPAPPDPEARTEDDERGQKDGAEGRPDRDAARAGRLRLRRRDGRLAPTRLPKGDPRRTGRLRRDRGSRRSGPAASFARQCSMMRRTGGGTGGSTDESEGGSSRHDRDERLGRGALPPGPVPGHELVEDAPEGELVRAEVDGLPRRLLGRHVADRPEERAGRRPGRGRQRRVVLGQGSVERRRLGEAEIEDLDDAVRRQDHVFGLQVAVDDAPRVRGGEPLGDLAGDLEGLGEGRPASVEELPQGLALEELHRQVRPPGVLADVVDRDDVRVVEGRGRARLGVKASDPARVADHVVRKHLDCDVAAESRVSCAPHLPHAACAEWRDDLVGADLQALAQWHWMSASIMSGIDAACGSCPGAHNVDRSRGAAPKGLRVLQKELGSC